MPYTLAYKDRYLRVEESLIESDTSNSIAFASIPDDIPTKLSVEWTGKQFTKLVSAVMTGAQLMFPDEANEIIWQLIKAVHLPQELDPQESGCVEYLPSAPFIKFFPDNPYVSGDRSAGWEKEAWYYWSNFDTIFPDWFDTWLNEYAGELLGYLPSDVLFNISSLIPDPLNPVGNLLEIIESGGILLPKIEIRFSGTGVVELGLLSFPFGGKCIIELDEEPNALDILTGGVADPSSFMVELNRDLLSFPPDEYPIINIEIPVTEAGNHVLYLVFLPVLNDELIPLGFGGGIRSIELCGFEEHPMAGIENVIFEDCTLKVLIDGVLEPVANFSQIYECIEALMATQAEIKQAIIDAELELMQRALAGESVNTKAALLLNTDGTKEYKNLEAPDNPDTPSLDEAKAARCGGIVAVETGLNGLLDFVHDLYGDDAGADTPVDDMQYIVRNRYKCDTAAMDIAVEDYFNNRLALFETMDEIEKSGLQNAMFKYGSTKQAVVNFVLSLTDIGLGARQVAIALINALTQEQLDDWYLYGVNIPSTAYIAYQSVPVEDESLELDLSGEGEMKTCIVEQKKGHRLLMSVSGQATDAANAGVVIDFFYRKNADGTITREDGIGLFTGAGFVYGNNPSNASLPYEPSGNYQFTVDTLDDGALTFIRDNGSLSETTVGTINISIKDLGEIF